jgi:hypothetical protein
MMLYQELEILIKSAQEQNVLLFLQEFKKNMQESNRK